MTNYFLINFAAILTIMMVCHASMDECYLRDGRSQRCLPPFVNAAYGKTVVASNTCGNSEEEYCLQTGVTGVTTSCHYCNNDNQLLRHDASLLTDLNDENSDTWWQSRTMIDGVQYPNMVNLTLDLDKAFDITYVRVRFHTSRPESFAIYKKTCSDCHWQPFQYYSGSCFSTYGIDNKEIVTVDDEQKPLCTDDFSDISPLTGGNVAFSTLESRPSAYNFDRSPVLQDWVKATAIRITLNRINTFGDEVFQDPNILKSYYYSISDLSVGGRCACNGHASECYLSAENLLTCRCQHNTAGRDCERCADLYNDRPWARATRGDAAECQACDCNGLSGACEFDPELYRQTGHGGRCINCRDFTAGPRCEQCLPNYYRDGNNRCTACDCNGIGSYSQQCDSNGQCRCKSGVGGERCDRCLDGTYKLSEAGCRDCLCSSAGSVEGTSCHGETGQCVCKLNVEGARCDICKSGTMNLQRSNPYGCTSCFCFGHSSVCDVSNEYTVKYIFSEFRQGQEGWTGRDFYNNPSSVSYNGEDIAMRPDNYYLSYFVAPDKFLGNQRFSYNQMLEFKLFVEQAPRGRMDVTRRSSSSRAALPSRDDLILEGYGLKVSASIVSQSNPSPNGQPQVYRFRLHEAAGFSPRLSPLNFQKMLNSLDKISIRSTYGEGLIGHLDDVQLKSAERFGSGEKADWVEVCDLDNYVGNFADQCAPGFTRDPPNGGEYAPCVPCNCNGHSDTCDSETGLCECNHNTMGDHCELCIDGYYFSGDESRRGTPQECQPCPCPQGSSCAIAVDSSVVCTSCPPGHAGKQCEVCMDGWFGDPRGRGPCIRCLCSGNIDGNAVMNCDRTTGECLKCIHNTTGFRCQFCLPGYFGKPVTTNPAERCMLCECDHLGSEHVTACNAETGQCQCLPNVEGRRCERCRSGFWNIASGQGCETCNCNYVGTSTGECDQDSGQCACLPGVGGQRCDRCLPNYYGISGEGCTACNCNPDGSESLQCDEAGRCPCKEGVLGEKCDKCQDNYYDIASGCVECPACYGLVQDAVMIHKRELDQLEKMEDNIGEIPGGDGPQGDVAFRDEMERLNEMARKLQKMANETKEKNDLLRNQTGDVLNTLRDLMTKVTGIEEEVDDCASNVEEASNKNARSKADMKRIKKALDDAEGSLKQAMMDLMQAEMVADDSLGKEDNMSRIAQKAEALANRHQASAKEIQDTAQNAYDTSRRAQNSIQEAVDILDNLMNDLEEMTQSESKMPAVRALRDDLLAQSGGIKNNAQAAKNDSTDLFTEANKIVVPSVDTDVMDVTSQDIQNEAEDLIPLINQLDSEYKSNYGELKANIDRAQELLSLADAAQDTADMLLAQAHGALEDGKEAVRSANETYHSVLATKKSLESFDEQIDMTREDAEAALGKIDAIQAKIDRATEITDEAKGELGTARTVATQANDKAQQASNIAQSVQTRAGEILNGATRAHGSAAGIAESLSNLEDSLLDAGSRLENKEDQAQRDADAVQGAAAAAGDAKQIARRSKNKVDIVLGQLEELLQNLNQMADVDEDEIAEMEALYGELRRQVDEAGLPEVIKDLHEAAHKQDGILQAYDTQIAGLRDDIANLRDIDKTIPKECSANDEVEQP